MKLTGKAVALVLLTAGASSAFAQTVPNPIPNAISSGDFQGYSTENGPLMVAVWDQLSGSSLVQWLGLRYNDVSIPEMSDSDFLDFGTLTGFSTTFATAIAAGAPQRLQYMVFAADPTPNGFDGFSGIGLRATGAANYQSVVQTSGSPDGFAAAAPTAIAAYISNVMQQPAGPAGCGLVNPCSVADSPTSPIYWNNLAVANPGSDLTGAIPGATSFAGAVGNALSFFETTVNFDENSFAWFFDPIQVASGQGNQWLLSTDGRLTYGAPIPLPAAAWLLLSGIAGLGAVARRRQAA
jgi:hypothetical protein